jgi:hypothetical protein
MARGVVGREQRDFLADAIHELMIGRISNDNFEERIAEGGLSPMDDPSRWDDAAIGPVLERAWCLYSDQYEYRLVGEDRLSRKGRAEVLRWLLFLRSDCEYRWPPLRFINPALLSFGGCLLSAITLGIWPRLVGRRWFEQWSRAGEFAVWPFLSRVEFEQVYAEFCPLPRTSAAAASSAGGGD